MPPRFFASFFVAVLCVAVPVVFVFIGMTFAGGVHRGWFLIAISKVLPVIEQENALKYQEAQEKQRVGETTPESEA